MCGFAGFFDPSAQFLTSEAAYRNILNEMAARLVHRGPDSQNIFLDETCGIGHTRLSIIDLALGAQPMSAGNLTIAYNGELYNAHALRKSLLELGISFRSNCDTEVILNGFLFYGPAFFEKLNGIFSFVIYDKLHHRITLARDPFGVKPIFFTIQGHTFVFSSELKGIFAHPGISAVLDADGLNELFGLGPARTPGKAVFKNISECKPGHYLVYDGRLTEHCYFRLQSYPHTDSYEDTVERTGELVTNAIKKQMVSDVPICTFLSGGLDSSIVTALCAKELGKRQETLSTFSFDFTDNDKYFSPSRFQPSQDRPFVDEMVDYLKLDHHYLFCDTNAQADLLYESVKAHDLPCMADIDSSLLYFCGQAAKNFKVVLTGECADEVFGGYPWFHQEQFLTCHTFPWTPDLTMRKSLLNPLLLQQLHMDSYVQNTYETAIREIDILPLDNETETNRRQISYLNLRYFMQTLLNRMDRTSMHHGLEARVPFCDKELVSYVFNVPWEMKAKNGTVKNLLRESCRGLLPDSILFRTKSPYPKTYNPAYEKLLTERLRNVLSDPTSPLTELLDTYQIKSFLSSVKDLGKPWYGQLMAGPQMIAYLLQVEYWLRLYHVRIEL